MSADRPITRRDAVKLGLGTGLALTIGRRTALFAESPARQRGDLILRAIPSSGEKLPVVGVGTAVNYERVSTPDEIAPLHDTVAKFLELGGKVIDTAPAYGRAEEVIGDILTDLKARDKTFIATKVSVGRRGRRGAAAPESNPADDKAAAQASLESSLKQLQTDRIDLMQIWNVSNPDALAPILDEWKAAKKIRYTGITTSFDGQYDALEATMKAHRFDFVQVDLAIDNRNAQERIIPLAADRGMGVLINLPFGRTRVFSKVRGQPLPDWAAEIDATSWAQIFLKYIVSNPAVTTVIPGTNKVAYAIDNVGAARGRLPDTAMRKRIEAYFDAL
jgi:aryl-alcohol dehydrogenase-like predicted oxidoreductase